MSGPRQSRRLHVHLLLAGTLVAFSGQLLLCSTAEASCGDYLAGSMPVHVSVDPQQPERPPALPCRGPECSGNRDLPLPPAPVPDLERDQRAGLLIEARGAHAPFASPLACGDEIGSAGHPARIERPPR